MSTIDETLALVKELHSHSIINSDDYYSEKLLQVIISLSTLNLTKDTDSKLSDDEKLLQDEIAKVKRKVPKWMKKTHQYNYQILKAFMELSDNNVERVEVDTLEKYVDIGQAFLANYNNLKTISEKNHGKVFEEIDREVELWEPVAEFIEEKFIEGDKMAQNRYTYDEVKAITKVIVSLAKDEIFLEEAHKDILEISDKFPVHNLKLYNKHMKNRFNGIGTYGQAIASNWAKALLEVTNNDAMVIQALREQQRLYREKDGKSNQALEDLLNGLEK